MSDPQDDPPARPSRLRRASTGVHGWAESVRRSGAGAGARLRAWDQRRRRPPRIRASEQVCIDERRHPFMLVLPGARTAVGLVVLVTGLRFWWLLALALLIAVWVVRRLHPGARRTATVAGALTAGLVVLTLLAGPVWTALVLLLWLAEDVADWYFDRLVVTDQRLYRCYGVLRQHSPSISLTAIAYIDPSVTPLDRFFHYGTLSLDSAAQNDAPLSRFEFVRRVEKVSDDILTLRSKAMAKFRQQPL